MPISLTSMMYVGSLVLKLLLWVDSLKERGVDWDHVPSVDYISCSMRALKEWLVSRVYNVTTWRNFVVAPVTEELVFRACMLPLILCGGFRKYTYYSVSCLLQLGTPEPFYGDILSAKLPTGESLDNNSLLLRYTVVFGSYASFLYLRSGHLLAPLAHVLCNYMGLPALFSRGSGLASLAFMAGLVSFTVSIFR